MNRPVLKYLFLVLVSSQLFAQQADQSFNKSDVTEASRTPIYKSTKEINLIKASEEKSKENIITGINKQQPVILQHKSKTEPFNIVSSFRSNIRFGGFWGKYAIVNFTPQVLVKPAGFISIYANHSTSCFIPMDGIKEHMEKLCIQGAAILAVDNTIKLFFGSDDMIPSIAGFIAKTLIINTVMSSVNKNSKNKMYDFKSYYYSVSIRL